MNVLKKLLIALGFKRPETVETITKPIGSIVTKLNAYAEAQTRQAEMDAEAAENLLKRSKEEAQAAKEAQVLASRYATLTA